MEASFSSTGNEFATVSEFLDAYVDPRLSEVGVLAPRSYGTPGNLATPIAFPTPGAGRNGITSPSFDPYSPYPVTFAVVKNDKPTPLRTDNLTHVDAPDSTLERGGAAGSSTVTDVHAVQGASSLLSLRTGQAIPVPNASPHEQFLLTAADPGDHPDDDETRLLLVMQAKYKAGLLAAYDYGAAYARFQRYLETNISPANRQRVQNAVSTFRPAFQAIAQSLTDMEVILVEEAFERLVLHYSRIFSSVGVPACLWRRTGQICKVNKEFAALVDMPYERLESKDFHNAVCIYELMSEESTVNYWEKYANIAFDNTQKAVLMSCVLKSVKGGLRPCSFSFTIRRDRCNLPFCLVGNFIPV